LKLHLGEGEVVDLGVVEVRTTTRIFDPPPVSHPLSATLGARVELLGYDLSSDTVLPGETLMLTLTWRARTEMVRDYTVFAHLLDSQDVIAGQHDQQPMGGAYPTSLWAPGEVVSDVHTLRVDPAARPADHRLEVGMYLPETGTRLAVEGDPDNAVTLQTIVVGE
jgi:hypothetical protein